MAGISRTAVGALLVRARDAWPWEAPALIFNIQFWGFACEALELSTDMEVFPETT